jgi:beta-glucosidase-like glycosyl hydrolase
MTDPSIAPTLLDSPAHRQLALEASEQGIVMLLNTNRTLPLKSGRTKKMTIALIGESASRNFTTGSAQHLTGKPDKYHCKAQMHMLGKTQVSTRPDALITTGGCASVAP